MKFILLFTILFHLLRVHGVVVRADSMVGDVTLDSNVSSDGFEKISLGFSKPTTTPSQQVASRANAETCGTVPSFIAGTQSGVATFYSTDLTACGITINANGPFEFVAVSTLVFDNFPGNNGIPSENPVCGRKVIASHQGKSVTATIIDRCEACQKTDLDLSVSAFAELADLGLGRIDITWVFC